MIKSWSETTINYRPVWKCQWESAIITDPLDVELWMQEQISGCYECSWGFDKQSGMFNLYIDITAANAATQFKIRWS